MIEFEYNDGKGSAYHVTGDVLPGSQGARDSLGGVAGAGPPLEPDDEPEFEIDEVLDGNGDHASLDALPDDLVADICEAGLRHAEEAAEEAWAEEMVEQHDAERDDWIE